MSAGISSDDPTKFTGQLVYSPWFDKQWMLAGNPALFFDQIVQTHGDFVFYRGLIRFYLINHPALVKQVLQQTHKSFDKNSVIYNRFRNAFGDGLVVAEGERWKRQRKRMQPFFGHRAIQRFFDIMLGSAETMINRWERTRGQGQVFDIARDMNEITLEIAGRSLFHDGFDEQSTKIGEWTETIDRYSAKPPLPLFRRLWFPSRINRRLKRTLGEFHAFLSSMIDQRRHDGPRDDLLSTLMHTVDENSGEPMTDAEVSEEVLGMIIGGHETSSSALTWIWYEIDRNPSVQSNLLDEIQAVLGNEPITPERISKLVYTRMVIDECLRLHPPFWFENRNTIDETELGGVVIPRRSMVAFSRWSLHRNVRFWKDPDVFDPERFRPDQEENARSTHACVPFGGGPRICIGVHFAMMELLIIVATVCRRFRVRVDNYARHEMTAHLTMNLKHGLHVRLEDR